MFYGIAMLQKNSTKLNARVLAAMLFVLALFHMPAWAQNTDNASPENQAEMITLYEHACKGGYMQACYNLGLAHGTGKGVPVNTAKARQNWQKACDGEYAAACRNLGVIYRDGMDVQIDGERAADYFDRACKFDSIAGCYEFGLFYFHGQAGQPKNMVKAASGFSKVCQAKHEKQAEACLFIGAFYLAGEGVKTNPELAFIHFKTACEGGQLRGCHHQARLMLEGAGTNKQTVSAQKLLKKNCAAKFKASCEMLDKLKAIKAESDKQELAAQKSDCEAGDSEACAELALNYFSGASVEKDLKLAQEFYARACDLDSMKGCFGAAYIFDYGKLETDNRAEKIIGLYKKACIGGFINACANWSNAALKIDQKRDAELIGEHLQRACDQNDGIACTTLGNRYFLGQGFDTDFPKAIALYDAGCRLDNVLSCAQAGENYRIGFGIEKQPEKAEKLLTKACDKKVASACVNLGQMALLGEIGAVDAKKAVGFFRRACTYKDMAGCYNLGVLYEAGKGVERDMDFAGMFFVKACDRNQAEACLRLGHIAKNNNVLEAIYKGGMEYKIGKAKDHYKKACDGKIGQGCSELALMYKGGTGGLKKNFGKAQEYYNLACKYGDEASCDVRLKKAKVKAKVKKKPQAAKAKKSGKGYTKHKSGKVTLDTLIRN